MVNTTEESQVCFAGGIILSFFIFLKIIIILTFFHFKKSNMILLIIQHNFMQNCFTAFTLQNFSLYPKHQIHLLLSVLLHCGVNYRFILRKLVYQKSFLQFYRVVEMCLVFNFYFAEFLIGSFT